MSSRVLSCATAVVVAAALSGTGTAAAATGDDVRAAPMVWQQSSPGNPLTLDTSGSLPGLVAEGQIFVAQAEELYVLRLDAGHTYAIEMAGSPTDMGTLSDPLLRLRDANGTEVAANDDGGTGFNARIVYTPVTTGLFTIAASSYGSATGSYRIRVEETTEYADDYPGHAGTQGSLMIGQPITGTIEYGADADWFAVQLTGGQTYVINLEGAPTGRGSLSDPLLTVHAEDGREVGANDDFGGTLNSQVTLTAPTTGRYFVSAQSYGYNTGTYTLTVSTSGGGQVPVAENK
ncbi:MAG: PPC domain-containing protein [Rhodospirillaceae bacterium]|nr:PPC domain-containing protein [Rhodospirillaceae bacterium]MCA8931295.1 PPC domain-containing protein [Rhodospirillaceae bacterium]